MNTEEIRKYWEEYGIPERALKLNKGRKKFYFLDGPPYASGAIHIGTALNKILKDYYIRFFRMQGFDVHAQPGYDCHGVPIELRVEKELGLKNKKEIEKYGVEKFIERCKHYATNNIGTMSSDFKYVGVWMDWDNPYLTLSKEYIENVWLIIKKAYEKGLLYKGLYPVHVCPRCETVVAYNEIVYKTVTENSIYVKFRLKDNEFFIVWTTTPWTLPANTGIMVHPDFDYAKVEVEGEVWIMAEELLEGLSRKFGKEWKILEVMKGEKLVGLEYESLFKDLEVQKNVKAKVVGSRQYVTLEKGTGLVHCAPGHGLEDYEVGKENGLKVLCPVKLDGTYDETVGKWAGRYVKSCDPEIIEELDKRGMLVHVETVSHEYPMCWRCESPLLFVCIPQWFLRITSIKEKVLEEAKKINWVPKWAGKRFEDWLNNVGDWPITRQRYWGTPAPIWECEKCGNIKVISKAEELPEKLEDYHKPKIDEIVFECSCGGKMKRIPDVLDVWMDSAAAPWASLNYVQNKEDFERLKPVDLVIEGADQIRGWWNSVHLASIMVFDETLWRNIVWHGFVLEEHGKSKLSKSKGGVTPYEFAKEYPIDLLRLYLLSVDSSVDFNLDWEKIDNLNKDLVVFENIFKFYKTYCSKEKLGKDLKLEDKWIVSKFHSLIKKVKEHSEKFEHSKAVNLILEFTVNELSRKYIKLVRERIKEENSCVSGVLTYILNNLIKLYAPILPILSEKYYLELFKEKESIHFEEFPKIGEIDENLEEKFEIVFQALENCLAARNIIKMNIRQPLRRMYVVCEVDLSNFEEILKRQCNVEEVLFNEEPKELEKYVVVEEKGVKVYLNKEINESLLKKGFTREIIRRVQQARKNMGLVPQDKIKLKINVGGFEEEELKNKTNTIELEYGENDGFEFDVGGEKVNIKIWKVE
ncbi:MAG: isoleucine--tRNA ligase [archaeon]